MSSKKHIHKKRTIYNTSFRLRLTRELLKEIRAAAKSLGMSVSEFVRSAMRERINPTPTE